MEKIHPGRMSAQGLLFLIYINDLSDGVSSNWKRFADNTSLFSVVNDIQSSAATLRNDLTVISNWTFQWKMIFNPDLTCKCKRWFAVEELRNCVTLVFRDKVILSLYHYHRIVSLYYYFCNFFHFAKKSVTLGQGFYSKFFYFHVKGRSQLCLS